MWSQTPPKAHPSDHGMYMYTVHVHVHLHYGSVLHVGKGPWALNKHNSRLRHLTRIYNIYICTEGVPLKCGTRAPIRRGKAYSLVKKRSIWCRLATTNWPIGTDLSMIKLELPSERNGTKSDYLYASSISKLLSITVMYMCEVAGFNSPPKMRCVPSDTV